MLLENDINKTFGKVEENKHKQLKHFVAFSFLCFFVFTFFFSFSLEYSHTMKLSVIFPEMKSFMIHTLF